LSNIIPVILSGGSGTRLWPLSRKDHPKQYLPLVGDSTYIPIGIKHSLENKTNEQLEIIEVQSGTYLGEDDIVRFEDIYDRIKD
jgi:mannose-1-phosphate guanylyltransferase